MPLLLNRAQGGWFPLMYHEGAGAGILTPAGLPRLGGPGTRPAFVSIAGLLGMAVSGVWLSSLRWWLSSVG